MQIRWDRDGGKWSCSSSSTFQLVLIRLLPIQTIKLWDVVWEGALEPLWVRSAPPRLGKHRGWQQSGEGLESA